MAGCRQLAPSVARAALLGNGEAEVHKLEVQHLAGGAFAQAAGANNSKASAAALTAHHLQHHVVHLGQRLENLPTALAVSAFLGVVYLRHVAGELASSNACPSELCKGGFPKLGVPCWGSFSASSGKEDLSLRLIRASFYQFLTPYPKSLKETPEDNAGK